MTVDGLRVLIEPLLEALAERVHWAPVVFVPTSSAAPVIGCGSTPKDVDLAREVVADGRALKESVVVGVDRWVRVFPVAHGPESFGHVALLGRVVESNVPALTRLIGVLSSALAGDAVAAGERGRRSELESSQEELRARLAMLDLDRRFHEELHDEISTGQRGVADHPDSLQRIIDCLARHLGAPVVLQGRNLITLAESGPDSASITLCPARHQSARDIVGPLSRARGMVELPASSGGRRRVVAPVWGGGELLGFLTAATDDDVATDTLERSLECTAGFVAMERVIRSEVEEAQQLDRDALLRDLFSATALHRLTHRGLRLDIDLRRAYVPCAFVPAPGAAASHLQLRSVVVDALRDSFGSTSEAVATVFDDLVVALVPEDAHQGLNVICDRIVKHADNHGWRVRGGIGPVCRELSDYEPAIRKARWVTETLDSMDGQSWAHFDDFGIYSILFDREQSNQLDDFVVRQLGPLVRYDEDHRTDLVETLRCVLDTGAVLTEAAKQLFIHISTLKYRVNRIEELLGVELRNPQTAFDLHLACKILSVRRQLSGASAAAGKGAVTTEAVGPPARKRARAVPAEDVPAAK